MPSPLQFLIAIGIFVASIIVATIVARAIKNAKFLTGRTKTTLDDTMVSLLARPIHVLFQVSGIVLAIRYLFPELSYRGYDYSDFMFVFLTAVVAYTLNRVGRGVAKWYDNEIAGRDTGKRGILGFFETLVALLIWGFALLFVLRHFGVDVNALFAGLGIAGLAVALGLQNTLSGVFSAVHLAIDKPLRPGDFVTLEDGSEGFVEDIGLRSTRLRTFSNNYIVVPNTKLANMVITNYYQPAQEIGVVVNVGVSYDTDLAKAETLTIDVAKKILADHGGVPDFEPFVRYKAFGASSIDFIVVLRVGQFIDQYVVRHEFIKALKHAFDKEGIEIPFPQLHVHTNKDV